MMHPYIIPSFIKPVCISKPLLVLFGSVTALTNHADPKITVLFNTVEQARWFSVPLCTQLE